MSNLQAVLEGFLVWNDETKKILIRKIQHAVLPSKDGSSNHKLFLEKTSEKRRKSVIKAHSDITTYL